MKIKTITCHNVFNYGASLQAHALMHYLTTLGHDVEVIDYMPSYIRKNLGLFAIGPKYKSNPFIALAFFCYVVPIRMMQYKARRKYKDFLTNFLHLTKRYNSYEELKNCPPQADVYFCGSDQIWNTNINNGLDPAFYLDFAPKTSVRASYAASFSISEIPKEHCAFVGSMLKKMDFISVREKTGIQILNHFGINYGENVCDPVFLLTKEHWESTTYVPRYKNYILVYDQENSKDIRQLAQYIAKRDGKRIVALKNLYSMGWADYQEKYAGPIDFVSLIAHADLIISNSFHCSAFSIIMERQFYVVNRTHQKVNSRMKDLLETLGISHRLVEGYKDIEINECMIDYAKVNPKMELLKHQSMAYIDKVLTVSAKDE